MAAFDYEVVVVGSGPAGLTAATELARGGHRVLVLERDLFGGALQHTIVVEGYREFPDGIPGADLAGKLIEQATSLGVAVESGDVTGVELFSRSRWVACEDGRGFSCGVVILACGTHYVRLGLPNEEKFRGRGVVDCTPCDGGFFVDRDVVVYGSGELADGDARYLSQLGARVTSLAPEQVRLDAILGSDRLEAIAVTDLATAMQRQLTAYGLLVRVGLKPASAPFEDLLDLDDDGRISTNADLETSARYVLACGDVRAGSTWTVAAAVDDGLRAAARASQLLSSMG